MDNKNNGETKSKIIFSLIGVFILVLAVFGISYAVWSNNFVGKKENVLKTGSVSFSYKEDENRYISIENAEPMSDSDGMRLEGNNNVFDFHISAKQKGLNGIIYYIYAEPDQNNTLSGDYVKFYLTNQNDEPINYYKNDPVLVYSKLGDYYCDNEIRCKLIYKSDLKTNDFDDNYRLRVWLSSDFSDNDNQKTFAFKVNVKGE